VGNGAQVAGGDVVKRRHGRCGQLRKREEKERKEKERDSKDLEGKD